MTATLHRLAVAAGAAVSRQCEYVRNADPRPPEDEPPILEAELDGESLAATAVNLDDEEKILEISGIQLRLQVIGN